MSRGRCPGCGRTDPSSRKIESHMASCLDVATLYGTNPERVVHPEAEYARWKAEEDNQQIRDERRMIRVDGLIQDIGKKIVRQEARWATPNLLDD